MPDAIRFAPQPFDRGRTIVFLVTIADTHGASATGQVSITFGYPPTAGGPSATNPPKIGMLPGNKAALSFHGIPGRAYRIQRSTDLRTWADLGTVVADPLGNVTYTADASVLPTAYFRIAIP